MKTKILVLGIALLFLLGTANASDLAGNFSVSTNCLETSTLAFSLTNDLGEAQSFKISSTGETRDWINLNGKWLGKETLEIALASGETKELYAFIKPQNCYVKPGDYDVIIQVSSTKENFSKTIKVTVNPSRILSIDVNAGTIELRQCEQKTFTATIANTGKSDELINISVSGIPTDWVLFSKEQFLLEKQHSKQLNFTLKPECAAVTKDYSFTINASILNTDFITAKSVSFKILDAQTIEILSDSLNACADRETTAPIRIKNTGRLADSLFLSASGLEWASINQDSIEIDSGQEKTINVSFKKTSSAPKEHSFTFKARSKLFGKYTEKEFTVKLRDCYGLAIASVKANNLADAVPTACIEESLTYEFELLNDRAEAIELDAGLRNINAILSPSKATIKPTEKQVFTARIDLSNETPGDKNFALTLKSNYFSETKQYSFKAVDCFALAIDYDGLKDTIDVNASDSKTNKSNPFIVSVKNTGTKKVQAKAEVIGPNWIYFQPSSFALNPEEQKAVYLYFDPPYDTKEGSHKSTLKISAEHFSDSKETIANVYGGLYSMLGKANVSASGELSNLKEAIEKTVELQIKIKNDSNALLKISDLNVLGYNADFAFVEAILQPEEELTAKMTLFLGKDFSETQFSVPLKIFTDKGTIVKDIQVDLNTPKKQLEPMPVFGFFSLAGIQDFILVALIAVVIALVLIVVFRMSSKPKEKTEVESYWKAPKETETTGIPKGLEEISKKIRAKPKQRIRARKKRK